MHKYITTLVKIVLIGYFIFVVAKIGLYRQALHKQTKAFLDNSQSSLE